MFSGNPVDVTLCLMLKVYEVWVIRSGKKSAAMQMEGKRPERAQNVNERALNHFTIW